LQGSQSALTVLVDRILTPECAAETTAVTVGGEQLRVDIFPASPGPDCPYQEMRAVRDTTNNLARSTCQPVVAVDVKPWTYVAKHQAQQICAKMGKQLLPSAVWYQAALGTPDDTTCHTSGVVVRKNAITDCVSGIGTFDMVGNVWEWVGGEVVDGVTATGQVVPQTGYVAAVNHSGWPTKTSTTTNDLFNADYFWSDTTGTRAMMRGGFYAARSDAGVYALHAGISPSFSSNATGVRCGYRLP
jgi:hypothetical protein